MTKEGKNNVTTTSRVCRPDAEPIGLDQLSFQISAGRMSMANEEFFWSIQTTYYLELVGLFISDLDLILCQCQLD